MAGGAGLRFAGLRRELPGVTALLAVGAALLAACGASGAAPGAAPAEERGVVAYVNDGDTLRLVDGRRVRLVQVDAPELGGGCYGAAARRALLRLVPPGTRVTLERDPALDATDAYGRLLRYVVASGRNVNLALVEAGAAAPYLFRGRRGRYAGELLRAARRARSARRGLWGACPAARLAQRPGAAAGGP